MKKLANPGKVILVGAGPGDPELLTLKALKYIRKAEVILTDRLVSEDIINEYASPEAEVIYVGKQCRKGNSTLQSSINDLIVHYASLGKLVVRLKGGDVSIFSNVLDELETVVNNNIPYEIVPGITAASGAAAYAGIPLTARNYSTSVRFLTSYKNDIVTDEYWKELSQSNDTLVFYMSSETIDNVINKLTENNIDKSKLLAVIEQATTPLQNVYISDLYSFKEKWGDRSFISPSLIIIGKVVSLHEQFNWVNSADTTEEYFKVPEDSAEIANKTKRA